MEEQVNTQSQLDQNTHVQNPPPPITPPTPDPIQNIKPKKSPIIPLLIFIIILLLGVIGYLAYTYILNPLDEVSKDQTSETKQTAPTPITDLTTNWETYNNAEYGYTFKCPNTSKHRVEVSDGDGQKIPLYQEGCFEEINQIRIQTYSSDYVEPITIGEVGNDSAIEKELLSPSGEVVKLRGWKQDYFNQIFSTFKFTQNNQSLDTTTYTNSNLGFSLNIPNEWSGFYQALENNTVVSFEFTPSDKSYENEDQIKQYPIFSVSKFTAAEWQEIQNEIIPSGKPREITSTNEFVYTYSQSIDNPFTGDNGDTYQKMVGQIQQIISTFKLIE